MSKRKFNRNPRLIELRVYKKRSRRRIYVRTRNFLHNRKKDKYKGHRSYGKVTQPIRKRVLSLPLNFSFLSNPSGVMEVFAKFREYAHAGTDVILDFRAVETITPDVIPILLAKVNNYHRLINISGTKPEKKELDNLLLESGFYKMVGLSKIKSDKGFLETHKSKVVDTELAVQARKLAAEKSFGDQDKRIQPLYRTLIECMANTHKHASDQKVHESWWLSVYNHPGTKITSFSFFDTGIGIFKSAKIEKITKFAVKLGLKSNGDVLKRILEGKITSSTGLPYRGKGLPKIYSDYKANSLKKLCIAANDTFADFDTGTFVVLNDELNGTFLYWEISPN